MKLINITQTEYKHLIDKGYLYLNHIDIYKIEVMTEINRKVAIRDSIVNIKIHPDNINFVIGELLNAFINKHNYSFTGYKYYLQSTNDRISIEDLVHYRDYLITVDGENVIIVDEPNYIRRYE